MAPPVDTASMRAALDDEWKVATRDHAFLVDVNAGKVTPARFNTWLAQDYKYVCRFARMLGVLISVCPDDHLSSLVGGMAAIDAEMAWFVAKSKERGIDLAATPMQPACVEYVAFLKSLHTQPYAVQASAFWAMEAVYNQAWTRVGEGLKAPEYAEFVDRWGTPAFAEYVVTLAAQADEALASAPPEERAAADEAVRRVLKLELSFWDMAYHVDKQ